MSNFPPHITAQQVLGLDASALVEEADIGLIHPDVAGPVKRLRDRARLAGFEMKIASGYRDFSRQLAIFNAKARGQSLDMASMSAREQLYAILRFSALPGTSRHHWGTDFDVYDAAAMPAGYCVQLTPGECLPGAVFGDFHQWLNTELANGSSDFYRPYHTDTGGVAPEPWHISYAPVARRYGAYLNAALLRGQLLVTDIALKEIILAELDRIFEQFVVQSQPQESK